MRNIAENIFSRAGILAFTKAIGFGDRPISLPHDPSVEVVGQRGTLRCFLISSCDVTGPDLIRIAQYLRTKYATELQLFIFATCDYDRVAIAAFNNSGLATLTLERGHVRASDVDALSELAPLNGEGGMQLAMRHTRALDRVRITDRFFHDFRAQRSVVADAWIGLAPRLEAERNQLALLLLSRLMFLYILQRRGFMCGRQEYFLELLRLHFGNRRSCSFYRGVLRPLFFGVLNRRPEMRTRRAAALGDLPYLNGGLFERHHLERRYPKLDLPDDILRGVFEHLLERYRFTASESSNDLAVDPEMLGRVFEGLMEDNVRQSTGTFYTPAPVVERMVSAALSAHLAAYPVQQHARVLREVRVLDPACGSGAFLLRALTDLADASGRSKRDIVARNLHGVDLQHDAALLCALRLGLCLIPDDTHAEVQPLPNLDRKIRQGDSLIDPLDLAGDSIANSEVRAARRALEPLVQRYTTCDPEERQGVHRLVARSERKLAHAWLGALQHRLEHDARELRAAAAARDLFGEVPASAADAKRELVIVEQRTRELKRLHRALRDNGAQPFFSFNVHFAGAERAGFDVVLCNPPWVRSHNWPNSITPALRRQFRVCHEGGQVDLAVVFLERAISLLADGGTLAIILPAKFLRSESAAAARDFMLEKMEVLSIEDHSLDQRSIFAADAFTCILIARRRPAASSALITVSMIRRRSEPLSFSIQQSLLRFAESSRKSPWLLVPPAVRNAMLQMQTSGVPVSEKFRIRRGVVTGSNAVMIATHAEGKLGDLAAIKSEGGFEAVIEDDALCPLIRGCDLDAWSATAAQKIIFSHDEQTGKYKPPSRRLRKYLATHTDALIVSDARGRIGALQHLDADSLASKVAWHDLADNLKAVALPARISSLGKCRSLIVLNTVYFIAAGPELTELLAAFFNSLPMRVFARAIAERAKDAHFRFFAGTVGQLPLPYRWQDSRRLMEISHTAHRDGAIDGDEQNELDEIVAQLFGLSKSQTHALRDFDLWLRGAA